MATTIPWTDETWNPIRARFTDPLTGEVRQGWHCERVSAGCGQGYGNDQRGGCYAEVRNKGFYNLGTKLPYTRQSRDKVEIYLDEEALLQPLRWKKARRIFPCSMTDWMGAWVPDEWIDRMLAVAALCPQHTFLFLTKRAERLCGYLQGLADSATHLSRAAEWASESAHWLIACGAMRRDKEDQESDDGSDYLYEKLLVTAREGFSNCWQGISCEDQKTADERIPYLLQTPAAVRFISAEPLLGPVEFSDVSRRSDAVEQLGRRALAGIDWVIVGGESGPRARPFNVQWGRSIIGQCKAASVPVFMKQLGAKPYLHCDDQTSAVGFYLGPPDDGQNYLVLLKDRKGEDLAEWPEDLRIREFPA